MFAIIVLESEKLERMLMNVSGYDVCYLVSDNFRLDGGAMFGAVPRTLWQRHIEPDQKNRIPLTCRLLLLRNATQTILVDVGCGINWNEKLRDIFAIENLLASSLSEACGNVTDIVLTHLHFDHAAGISYRNSSNNLTLSFPDANVFVSDVNWNHARNPGVRERASYLPDTLVPLESAKLKLTQHAEEILPSVKVELVNGHTHGLQWLLIGEGSDALAYPADLIPTAHHIPVPYVMGYDLCAETSMREKEHFLDRAVRENWTVVFEHDRDTPAARIIKDDKGRYSKGETVEIPELKLG